MSASSFDPTDGHPIFSDADAPDVARNPTEVAEFAAEVGTRLVGTTAERNAYAYARNGLEWRDTTLKKTFVHDGSGWVMNPVLAAGTLANATVPANSFITTAVVFPTGRFNVAPVVTANPVGASRTLSAWPEDVTNLGFNLLRGSTSGANQTASATWTAVQMTPTTGAG